MSQSKNEGWACVQQSLTCRRISKVGPCSAGWRCQLRLPVFCALSRGEKPPASSGLNHKIRSTDHTGTCKFAPNDRDGKSVLAEGLSFPSKICHPAKAPKLSLRPMGGPPSILQAAYLITVAVKKLSGRVVRKVPPETGLRNLLSLRSSMR